MGDSRNGKETLIAAAELLSGTVAVCRKYYVHIGLCDAEVRVVMDRIYRIRPTANCALSVDEQLLARFMRNWKSVQK